VIEVFKTDSFFWTNPGKEFSDFVFEIDGTKQAGPDNNGYGVILRYVDQNNFYRFDISSDGYYGFGYYKGDNWTSLIDWTESSAINQGDATNTITVLCKGSKFTFFINGEKLTDFTDTTFSAGDIGLWAGAVEESGVKIAFDQLSVWNAK
jgi:eukaryotic-like serine/threonine-protein kinase